MKGKKIILALVAIATLSMVVPAMAKPAMYLEMQCEVTAIEWIDDSHFKAYLEGTAGGPDITKGTVKRNRLWLHC